MVTIEHGAGPGYIDLGPPGIATGPLAPSPVTWFQQNDASSTGTFLIRPLYPDSAQVSVPSIITIEHPEIDISDENLSDEIRYAITSSWSVFASASDNTQSLGNPLYHPSPLSPGEHGLRQWCDQTVASLRQQP